jgi:hypothetical protein
MTDQSRHKTVEVFPKRKVQHTGMLVNLETDLPKDKSNDRT